MKKILTILTLALAVGCVPAGDDKDPQTCDEQCQQNNNENNENNEIPKRTDLKGSFISGHLGSYWDCPEQGYVPGDANAEPGTGAAPADDADFIACEEGTDCGGPLNCEGATLTIRLTNGGVSGATQIDVSKIEIFDVDGVSLAILPVIAVFDASSTELFDGELAAGESVDLLVDFQGPANLYDLLPADDTGSRSSNGDAALIEITVTAEEQQDVVIDGGEVFVLPTVVT